MKHEIKVGFTVLASAIILSVALLWVKDFEPNAKQVHVLFNNVSGLEIGSVVTVNGVKKGKVKTMELESDHVKTTLQLSDDVVLYENATARLMMLELMTGKKIELTTGTDNYPELQSEAVLQGEFVADVPQLVGYAGEALDSLSLLARELHLTLKNANGLLGDQALQNDLKITVRNMRVVSGDLISVGRSFRDVDIKALVNKVDSTLESIHNLTDDLGPELKTTLNQTTITVENANELILSLKDISNTLKTNQSTLAGKILNDSLFMYKLDRTITNLDSVLKLGQDQGIKIKLNIF
jgi:phospholipid/cholesterol/gamma-HCH transport system substrate-binding protein